MQTIQKVIKAGGSLKRPLDVLNPNAVVGSVSPCIMRTGGGGYIALIGKLQFEPDPFSLATHSLGLSKPFCPDLC